MRVESYDDISDYYDKALPFLLEKEAENNLILGILDAIKKNPHRYGENDPVLTTVIDGAELKLVAIRTPPFNQLLSYTNDLGSIGFLVDTLNEDPTDIPGVFGTKECAKKFARLWCKGKKIKANWTPV